MQQQKKAEGDKYLLLKVLFAIEVCVIFYIVFIREHNDPHLI